MMACGVAGPAGLVCERPSWHVGAHAAMVPYRDAPYLWDSPGSLVYMDDDVALDPAEEHRLAGCAGIAIALLAVGAATVVLGFVRLLQRFL